MHNLTFKKLYLFYTKMSSKYIHFCSFIVYNKYRRGSREVEKKIVSVNFFSKCNKYDLDVFHARKACLLLIK
jgi:hypothetical protein